MSSDLPSLPSSIVSIGGGNMGAAIIDGLRRLPQPPPITVVDPSPSVGERFRGSGMVTTSDPAAAAGAGLVILAVKPQLGASVAAQLQPHLAPGQLLVSILAGTTLATLQSWFPQQLVLRAMPNTPMAIGRGMVGLTAGDGVSPKQLAVVEAVFAPAAAVLTIPESQMDGLTAISGSGPAYLFHFAECLHAAAREQGFADNQAQQLVATTLAGAVEYLCSRMQPDTEFPAATLRQQVTSPGGTTAAALEVLQKADFAGLIAQAVSAAQERSQNLAAQS